MAGKMTNTQENVRDHAFQTVGERDERETLICCFFQVPNLGIYPNWELNPQPVRIWDVAPTN